jgi:hypothetical protein
VPGLEHQRVGPQGFVEDAVGADLLVDERHTVGRSVDSVGGGCGGNHEQGGEWSKPFSVQEPLPDYVAFEVVDPCRAG